MAATREPASIRYKNPGAMWGNALAIKWGAAPKAVTLNDGKGQGNNIAVFPTYVQGICAQLDLWRTSKNYRNKRFEDAIAIWSGHNEVPSYIAFCKKRVPGLTENTVMNDAFWQSDKGVAFLKAQAWHEAGKKYPAPDADWLAAQSIVFGHAAPVAFVDQPEESEAAAAVVIDPGPPPHAVNVQPPTATYKAQIETAQRCLDKLGYYEVGEIDGLMGGKTKGAITAFLNDRGLKDVVTNGGMAGIDDELSKAVAEGWTRPIAPSRATATAQDIAPKVASVAPAQSAGFFSKGLAWVAGLFTVGGGAVKSTVAALPDANDQASPYLALVQQYAPSVPSLVIFAIVLALAVYIARKTGEATQAIVTDYNTGKIN